jgi:hypothetical protein
MRLDTRIVRRCSENVLAIMRDTVVRRGPGNGKRDGCVRTSGLPLRREGLDKRVPRGCIWD